MPNFPLPSWLPSFPDVGEQVLRGYQLGAGIRQKEMELQQQANLSNIKNALDAQEFERNSALAQQKLAQEAAYNQQSMALDAQKLAEAKRLNDQQIQDAARVYQARQGFESFMQANPEANVAEAYTKYFAGLPGLPSQYGMGPVMHQAWLANQRLKPPQMTSVPWEGKNVPFYSSQSASGMQEWRPYPQRTQGGDPVERQAIGEYIRDLDRERKAVQERIDSNPARLLKTLQPGSMGEQGWKQLQQDKQELDRLNQQIDYERRMLLPSNLYPGPSGKQIKIESIKVLPPDTSSSDESAAFRVPSA